MAKKSKPEQHDVRWLAAPEEHDFPAAASYLSLLAGTDAVGAMIGRFRAGDIGHFKAKDILRAAQLALLEVINPHVASDLAKIAADEPLSPILLVRGDLTGDRQLHIADGYHRVCACYHTDENADIPCIVVDP